MTISVSAANPCATPGGIYTPAWLEFAGIRDEADALRALSPINSLETLLKAQPDLDEAEKKAGAARGAAVSAAESDARNADESAARRVAEVAFGPMRSALQESAFWLLDRMIALGRTPCRNFVLSVSRGAGDAG